MAQEVFINNFATATLVGNITSTATSMTLSTATGLPSSGQTRFLFPATGEIVIAQLNGTATMTIARGQENTTAAAHNNGDSVEAVVTAGGLGNISGLDGTTYSPVSGTTAGTATYSQPFHSATYSKVVVYLNGYQNSTGTAQTITIPYAFSSANVWGANSDPPCSASLTTITLPKNMTAPFTGLAILEGV